MYILVTSFKKGTSTKHFGGGGLTTPCPPPHAPEGLRPELDLEKKNIPENCLFYINQSYLLTVKNGDIAMYHEIFILGQIMVADNQPAEIQNYSCKANEVKLHTCIYDLTTGEF